MSAVVRKCAKLATIDDNRARRHEKLEAQGSESKKVLEAEAGPGCTPLSSKRCRGD